ncbi:MAG TPA: molybdopterin-dependent oxidoreductase, partial [Polyangiaceae bacterium]|nr:molybdopterin-dependent oxidoreductase [Polyangiaceae bacterium]
MTDKGAHTATRTVSTRCKVGACEPFCGVKLDIDAGRLTAVRPDREHAISEGYVCIKGMNLLGYQNSPDRVLRPLRRNGDDWTPCAWDDAIADIGARLRQLVDEHGPRAVGTYWGNAADSIGITMANTFCHAFGSPNSYNVLSLEYTDRGAVAEGLYGNENLILQPDVVRAKYALLLGTNPLVTQGLTLLQRRPHIGADLKRAMKDGGKVVVVDPRRTETARMASEHIAIRPGTDFFLLLALINVILAEGLHDRSFVAEHTSGLEALRRVALELTPDRASELTGIKTESISR